MIARGGLANNRQSLTAHSSDASGARERQAGCQQLPGTQATGPLVPPGKWAFLVSSPASPRRASFTEEEPDAFVEFVNLGGRGAADSDVLSNCFLSSPWDLRSP